MTIKHGITITEPVSAPRPIETASSAVIGLVAVGDDADAGTFPLNTPVLITDIRAAIGKAGAGGVGTTLLQSLKAIADQCSPVLVVVRVAKGVDDAATATNIIGTVTNTNAYTGMQALLVAEAICGVRPTILGVPKYDTQAVTEALTIVSKALRAFVYAKGIGAEVTNVLTYAGNFDDRDLMLIWPDFTDWAGSAVARALGVRALIDETQGFNVSLSNHVVKGVTGITKPVDFDILDATTTAGELNNGNVTTLIRNNGLRFWGNRTTSSDTNYAFEVATRSANVLKDTLAAGIAQFQDLPITVQWVQDVLATVNAKGRSFVAKGQLVGCNFWFDPSVNSSADLASGKTNFDFDFTVTAPAENIGVALHITDKYYATLAAQLGSAG